VNHSDADVKAEETVKLDADKDVVMGESESDIDASKNVETGKTETKRLDDEGPVAKKAKVEEVTKVVEKKMESESEEKTKGKETKGKKKVTKKRSRATAEEGESKAETRSLRPRRSKANYKA